MAVVNLRVRRLLRVVVITLAAAYAVMLILAYFFQTALIYAPEPRTGVPTWNRGAGASVVSFRAPNGPRLYSLYSPPRDAAMPVALIVHGNGGDFESWSPTLARWVRLGCGALLLDPRGYGWSEGSPSEQGFLADGEAALSWLESQGVPPDRIVLHGISLGCGIALPLAVGHAVRGLVLDSPFTSLADAAQASFPFLPCRLLLRERYDNLSVAPRVSCRVLVMHGNADDIVPVAQASRLAAAFQRPPVLRIIEGSGHNSLSSWPGYEPELAKFLGSLP